MDMQSIRSRRAMLALRLVIAGLIAAHGWARLIAGGVVPFGAWLDSLGFPLGFGSRPASPPMRSSAHCCWRSAFG